MGGKYRIKQGCQYSYNQMQNNTLGPIILKPCAAGMFVLAAQGPL